MFQFSLFAYEKVFRENVNIQPKKGNLFQQLYSKERRILKLNLNIMKNLMIYYLYILLISSSRISKTCDKFTSLQYLRNILNIAILVSQIGRLPFPKTSYPIDFIRVFMLSQAVKKKRTFFSLSDFWKWLYLMSSVYCLDCILWKSCASCERILPSLDIVKIFSQIKEKNSMLMERVFLPIYFSQTLASATFVCKWALADERINK